MQDFNEQIDKYFESNPDSKERISKEIHHMLELVTQDNTATEMKTLIKQTLTTYRNADEETVKEFNVTHSLSKITGYEDQNVYYNNICTRTAFEYTRDHNNSLPISNEQLMDDLVNELFEQSLTNYQTFLCEMFKAMIFTYINSQKK